MATLPPPPLQTPLVEPPDGDKPPTWLMTRAWYQWFLTVITRVQVAATAVVSLALTAQTASIAATSLLAVPSEGRYRVSFLGRITTQASVSSSLIPTVSYTRDGVACTQTGTALVSNATNAPASWVFMIKADASTPISYSTTLASVGTPPAYELDIVLEALN